MVSLAFLQSLQVLGYLAICLLAAALCGGLIAGAMRSATQIEEPVIGLSGRLLAVGGALYLFGSMWGGKLLALCTALWGGTDFFR